MIASHPHPDLLVIGGGVIGLAAAREAARRGLRVTVLERGDPGMGATFAAAGMLSPLSEAPNAGTYLEFGLRSLRLYPAWVAELEADSGVSVEFRKCGKLHLALSTDEGVALERRSRQAAAQGIQAEWVDRRAVGTEARGLGPRVHHALLVHDDFRVDNRKLTRALLAALQRTGVEIRVGTEVVSIAVEGGRVRGARLGDGTLVSAGTVLMAAGAWSGQISGLPTPPPVRPVRGQMLALSPASLPSSRVIETARVYLVPRDDGRLLVGATVEEVGFSTGNTAAGIQGLLDAAIELIPGLGEADIVELWSGLRPGTPDGNPILGPDPEVEGLLLATGHFRNGILLAPVTAQLLGAHAAGETVESIPEDFAAGRRVAVRA